MEHPFFTVSGQVLKVNGANVQVFEETSAGTSAAEAAQVAPDGGSISTSMDTWVATPHFFNSGRTLVLYVSDDRAVLDVLRGILGGQFAGQ